MLTCAASKQRPPFTACTGSENEMVTYGGEVAFVSRMIEESLVLEDRVQWYTSMLGKFSSLGTVVRTLREKGIGNYAVTEFVQGSKTRRWGVAWSFEDLRPGMDVSRAVGSLPKTLLPFPSEYAIVVSPYHDPSFIQKTYISSAQQHFRPLQGSKNPRRHSIRAATEMDMESQHLYRCWIQQASSMVSCCPTSCC